MRGYVLHRKATDQRAYTVDSKIPEAVEGQMADACDVDVPQVPRLCIPYLKTVEVDADPLPHPFLRVKPKVLELPTSPIIRDFIPNRIKARIFRFLSYPVLRLAKLDRHKQVV